MLASCGTSGTSNDGLDDAATRSTTVSMPAEPGDTCPYAELAAGGTVDAPATLGTETAAFIDGQIVVEPTRAADVTASDERAAVRWALEADSRPLHQTDPAIAVGVTAARIESAVGALTVPTDEVVWMVGFVGLLEEISSPVGSGGEPAIGPSAQRSDLYVVVDPADGRFLGSFSVPSGSCGSASSRDG